MKCFYFKIGKNISTLNKKLFFLTTIILLSYCSVYAQCKLEKTKDDFSSTQSVSSKEVTIASVFPLIGSKKPWNLDMSFVMVDSIVTIFVLHASQSYSTSIESMSFKFTDGAVIQAETPSATGDYNSGLGYRYTSTSFILSKEELMMFASKDLLKFRADFSNYPDYPFVEQDIKSKIVDKIRTDAGCLLKELKIFTAAQKLIKDSRKSDFDVPCQYETDKKDDFTKKRTVLTKPSTVWDVKVQGTGNTFMNVCGSNINGKNGLQFNRGLSFTGAGNVNEEKMKSYLLFDQLDILLENEEVVTLKEAEGARYIPNGNTYWAFKLFSIDNDSIWNKLKKTPLKKFRLSINGNELGTQEIENIYVKSIMKVIKCVDELGIPKSK